MSTDDFHLFRTDPDEPWRGIADVLEARPEAWNWALANIERWLAHGLLHPAPLVEWRDLLRHAQIQDDRRRDFLHSLRMPPANAHQDQLRSCSPFVGGPFRTPAKVVLSA